MTELEVKIVHLEPMRVAAAYGFGKQPEDNAWKTLLAWAKEKGLLKDLESHQFFGFNNPDPSPGSPNYGYEQWMTIGPDIKPEGDIKVKDFEGGLYAVTRCDLTNIGEVWKQLVAWREDSPYECGHHQWLEKAVRPETVIDAGDRPLTEDDIILDLYLPIAE